MKKQIVEIQWVDSMAARGWRSRKEVEDELWKATPIIHTVGYIFKRDKRKIAVVGSIDDQHPKDGPNLNHYHEIPMSAVRSIRKVR